MHIDMYRTALIKVKDAPLELTETDFSALAEFGGEKDETRGRDAQRRAQVSFVTKALATEPVASRATSTNSLITKASHEPTVPPVSWVLDFAVLTTKQERQVEEAVSSARYWYRENVKKVAQGMLADGLDEAFVADTVTALLTTFAAQHLAEVKKRVTDQVLLAG